MSYFFLNEYDNMEVYIPGEQPKDRKYIKLNANESSMPPSPKVLEAISRAQLNSMGQYSDPHCMELREAIGKTYGFGADQVFVGNGADEVLGFCMLSFFRPGINVEDYVKTDRDVILANPNNPTGQAISVADIERIVAANPKRMVIIDEAYVDYGTESCVELVRKYPNLVVVQTFSKSRNMAGARIGFAISTKEIIGDMNKIKFTFNPFNMSSFAIEAGTAAVSDTEYLKKCVNKIIHNREDFEDEMEKLGFEVIRTCTNFAFMKIHGMEASELGKELKKRGILVRHYPTERLNDYLRITIGTDEEMAEVVKNIKEIMERVTACTF